MANTAIPLSVQQVDIQTPLVLAAQRRQQEVNNQRQAAMDQATLADLALRREATGVQMEGQRTQNAAANLELQRSALQMVARDGIAFDDLVQKGDLQSAAMLGQEIRKTMQTAGLDTSEFDNMLGLFRDPAALKTASAQARKRMEPMLGQLFGKGNEAQFGGQVQVKDEAGNLFLGTLVKDPRTGSVQTKLAPIGSGAQQPQGQLQIVGQYGETGSDRMSREVDTQQGKAQVAAEEERASDLIQRGVLAAEGTAIIRRGIQLLNEVETGGPQSVALKAKQLFGIETADEGELSNLLGKAVLGQLRETFGAQFTEREGERLDRIEARFGKSTAANKRLLEQTLRISESLARRGQEAAQSRNQKEVVADIEDLLTFDLDIPDVQSGQAGGQSVGRFKVEVVQ